MNQMDEQPATTSPNQEQMTGQQVLEIVRGATAATPDKTWVTGSRKTNATIWAATIPMLLLAILMVGSAHIPGFSQALNQLGDALGILLMVLILLVVAGIVVIIVTSVKVIGNNKKMQTRFVNRSNQIRPRDGLQPGQTEMQFMTFGALDAFLATAPNQTQPIELLFACSPELRLGGSANVVFPEYTDPMMPTIPEGENCTVKLSGSKAAGQPLTVESLRKCLSMFINQYGVDTTIELRAFDESGAFCLTMGPWDIYSLDNTTYVIGGFVAAEHEAMATLMQTDKSLANGLTNWIKQERKSIAR